MENNISNEEEFITFEQMAKNLKLIELNLNQAWVDPKRLLLPKFAQAKIILNLVKIQIFEFLWLEREEIFDCVRKLNLLISEALKETETTNI